MRAVPGRLRAPAMLRAAGEDFVDGVRLPETAVQDAISPPLGLLSIADDRTHSHGGAGWRLMLASAAILGGIALVVVLGVSDAKIIDERKA